LFARVVLDSDVVGRRFFVFHVDEIANNSEKNSREGLLVRSADESSLYYLKDALRGGLSNF
jgi:hypothetical protein